MRAVIFDFDGVIVNSEPVHEAAIRDALAEMGIPATWTDWKRYMGLGDREAFAKILRDEGVAADLDDALLERFKATKKKHIAGRIDRGETPAYPGSVELIREATAALPAAVCSGSRPHEIRPLLARFGVEDRLRAIVTADDVRRTKPDPEPYLLTASRLGVEPRDCAVIEDTHVGVRAAVAAGCVVLAVEHTTPRDMLLEAGAHEVAPATAGLTLSRLAEAHARARRRG